MTEPGTPTGKREALAFVLRVIAFALLLYPAILPEDEREGRDPVPLAFPAALAWISYAIDRKNDPRIRREREAFEREVRGGRS